MKFCIKFAKLRERIRTFSFLELLLEFEDFLFSLCSLNFGQQWRQFKHLFIETREREGERERDTYTHTRRPFSSSVGRRSEEDEKEVKEKKKAEI